MLSREAEEEKEDTEELKPSGAPGCQRGDSLSGGHEGPPVTCDESQTSSGSPTDDSQLPSEHTGLSEASERNGEQVHPSGSLPVISLIINLI